jgi:modulator of FtsH protease
MLLKGVSMHGYDFAAWVAFFTALTGAAAVLTGLLFVAVSINLSNILKGATMLPARAAETLAMLLFVVISSGLALVPQDTDCSVPRSWSSPCP